jgi:hypothetical protein
MACTAKLSRRFDDHFGDELTNEFVDLINGMDTVQVRVTAVCPATEQSTAFDENLADRVRRALAGRRGVVEKRMFGGLAFMPHGDMRLRS